MKKDKMSSHYEEMDFKGRIEDPDNYKWGIFYFNKKDSRVILPKRNPYTGFTVNFANPFTYLILLGIIAAILVANYLG